MKGLILVVLLVAGALLAYNYVHTGKLTLIPSSTSKAEQQLQELEQRLDSARRQFEAAGRAAGVAGVDTTADAEAARREVERVESDLKELRGQLAGAYRQQADALMDKVQEFKKELR
jgi:outer membrane murein-binding lipoprotein Lpp